MSAALLLSFFVHPSSSICGLFQTKYGARKWAFPEAMVSWFLRLVSVTKLYGRISITPLNPLRVVLWAWASALALSLPFFHGYFPNECQSRWRVVSWEFGALGAAVSLCSIPRAWLLLPQPSRVLWGQGRLWPTLYTCALLRLVPVSWRWYGRETAQCAGHSLLAF